MTERVKVFTTLFNNKRPFFEEQFVKKRDLYRKILDITGTGSLEDRLNHYQLGVLTSTAKHKPGNNSDRGAHGAVPGSRRGSAHSRRSNKMSRTLSA